MNVFSFFDSLDALFIVVSFRFWQRKTWHYLKRFPLTVTLTMTSSLSKQFTSDHMSELGWCESRLRSVYSSTQSAVAVAAVGLSVVERLDWTRATSNANTVAVGHYQWMCTTSAHTMLCYCWPTDTLIMLTYNVIANVIPACIDHQRLPRLVDTAAVAAAAAAHRCVSLLLIMSRK